MKQSRMLNAVCAALFVFGISQFTIAQETATAAGKTPIIIIPGLTGTELINSKTGQKVWFRAGRAKDDDIRLPISEVLSRNRDSLIAGDIIREVKIISVLPEIEIYERLINALAKRGSYREAKWDTATKLDFEDTFYVFPYDWRRDNVENARLLIRRIETLKRRLGKPGLKFHIIAHSMGGLISRYAAMYGNVDIPAGTLKPTWAGARHLDKIFLLGTPNEGSLLSLDALLNGVSYVGSGINLPFVQNLTRFDVFTIPSIFQLLPHEGSLRAYDEDLKPLEIDIYEPATWDEYDWSIREDKDFRKRMSIAEQRNARSYFIAALSRAKRFQAALNANSSASVPVSFYLMGADCKETLNALILRRNEKKDRWETQFKAVPFTNSTGQKFTVEQLRTIIYTMGDSVVPKRSLAAETIATNGNKNVLPVVSELFQCEMHSKLVTNPGIQDRLFAILKATTLVVSDLPK
ncbi:MAG: lipase family alpha/beta hydrolase [Blastocatellia bacterium]